MILNHKKKKTFNIRINKNYSNTYNTVYIKYTNIYENTINYVNRFYRL